MSVKIIKIDDIEYVQKGSEKCVVDGMQYVIVRGDRSGVFAGYLKSREGREVVLNKCRRLWYWDGAASISQIALNGVSKPENCKFTVAVNKILILDAIEIIDVTQEAQEIISSVIEWSK